MRRKIYDFLVNRHEEIQHKYHQYHDGKGVFGKIVSWLYLLWLNFCYFVLPEKKAENSGTESLQKDFASERLAYSSFQSKREYVQTKYWKAIQNKNLIGSAILIHCVSLEDKMEVVKGLVEKAIECHKVVYMSDRHQDIMKDVNGITFVDEHSKDYLGIVCQVKYIYTDAVIHKYFYTGNEQILVADIAGLDRDVLADRIRIDMLSAQADWVVDESDQGGAFPCRHGRREAAEAYS